MPTLAPTPDYFGHAADSYRTDLVETPPASGRLDFAALERTDCCEVAPAGVPGGRRARFPLAGEEFLGFALVSELGSGAFGKVFLARQLALASRLVALKVTTRPTAEPAQLAKLHHTNIVPIYSVHDAAPLQAVCMPYLGALTLADVVVSYSETGVFSAARLPDASTQALARTATSRPAGPPTPPTGFAPAARTPATVLDGLSAAAQVEWVLRTVRGVAEGLAHAHERGILHLDLKPANVLLADGGAPLLLDFNLAKDLAAGPREQTGGTLPYMAPEQLDGFRERDDRHLDARTDLFGLGVIFYELLTGRHPFPRPAGGALDLARMARDRRDGPARVRSHNPAVPRAVEAIVEALLQPLPARRYPDAATLVGDLTRQLEGRPLAFAAEPSARERLAKWRRRNPRLGARLVTAALALAVVGLGGVAARHADARADAAAAEGHRQAWGELAGLHLGLLDRADPARRAAAASAAADLLARYGLVSGQPWGPTAAFRRLPAATRRELAGDCGELCRVAAASALAPGRGDAVAPPLANDPEPARAALAWLDLAAACDAEAATDPASEAYLAGVGHSLAARHAEAVAPLEDSTQRRPGHAAAQYLLAVCRSEIGDFDRAAERFLVAKALAPASGRPSLHRGAIALASARDAEAERDFTDALAREPGLVSALRLRGVARQRRGDLAGADADLTRFLGLDANSPAGYRSRAEVRDRLGDAAGADADRLEARRCRPASANDFVARGNQRAAQDPAGAEGDYRRAAAIDPRSPPAWQNLARLAARRGDDAAADAAQEVAVAAAPASPYARLSRAALHAQAGRRDLAHADVLAARQLGGGAHFHRDAARVYAATARRHPADTRLALDHLRDAFYLEGFEPVVVETDPSFDPLRDEDSFRELLTAAKVFAALGVKPTRRGD